MKQGNWVARVVMVLLAVGLLCYMGFYIWDSFNAPFTTTYAYAYTQDDGVQADGVLVREELVLPAQSGILEVTRGEGEKVGVGQTVAYVYRDEQTMEVESEIQALRQEIQLLDDALTGQEDGTAGRLDDGVLQALAQLRSSVAAGDLGELEEQVLAVKSGVLQREYTYGEGLSLTDLTLQRQQLAKQVQQLNSQISGATSRVRASQAGVFSSRLDGYEGVLTPQALLTQDLSALLSAVPEAVDTASPGKLIVSNTWYFAARLEGLTQEQADRLGEGKSYTLRFSGDFDQDISMKLERLERGTDGSWLAVFSTDRYLSQTTLLRRQTAQLIFSSVSGLRVPKQAVRMETTEGEDGAVEQRLGVYALVSGRAEFKQVEILREGTDYYVVQAAQSGSRGLRAGDEILLRATDLYDGKLLEY